VSLLGRSAFDTPRPTALLGVALCAFAMSIGAIVFVLLPRSDFVFEINGPAVYEGLCSHRRAVARCGDRRPHPDRQHYAVSAMADTPDTPEPPKRPDTPPPPPPPIPNIGLPQTGGKPKTF
jgi:hypothetical protein